jgi:multiple sugar transport system permease protein
MATPARVAGRSVTSSRKGTPGTTRGATIAQTIALAVVGLLVLAPLIYMIVTSLRTQGDIYRSVGWIPHPVTTSNYSSIWSDSQNPLGRWLANSGIVVLVGTMIVLLIDSLAAYSLARLSFPGRDVLFIVILSSMLVPGVTLLIPVYSEFANLIPNLNLINTYAPLTLVYGAGPFGVFLLRQFYLGIPKELEEAAMIDGAGKFRRWWQLILPLSRTPMILLGILTAIAIYNDYLWPLVATTSADMRTITVGIALVTTGSYTNNYGPLMAFAAMAAVPPVLFFFALQRYFVGSAVLSGVKG